MTGRGDVREWLRMGRVLLPVGLAFIFLVFAGFRWECVRETNHGSDRSRELRLEA